MSIETGTFDALGQDYESGSKVALLSAIAKSAETLTSGKGWPEGVDDLLADLGRITGVSRVWIFQTIELTETHITQDYPFEWAASGKHKQIGMPMFSMTTNKIDQPDYRDLIESRKRGEWQKVITHKLAPGWFRDAQEVQRIKSMLTIPIMVEGHWWGTLGFDDCDRAYDWSEAEISLLRIAGYLISNAILRDRLSAKRKQFDILQQITESNVWQFDLNRGQMWCSSDIIQSVPGPTENLRFSLIGLRNLVHGDDRKSLFHAARRYLKDPQGVFRKDIRVMTDCGGIRWVELIGNVSFDEKGKPEQFAGIAVDIRTRKREEERLRNQAATDPLTGVLNRRKFEMLLRRQMEAAANNRTEMSLLLLDLDNFKKLNDTHGHMLGDKVLKHFTGLCESILRRGDIIARLGGDEFAILLPNSGEKAAQTTAERLRLTVWASPFVAGDLELDLTVSIGSTTYDGSISTPAKLIEHADNALYVAKEKGRNRVVLDSSLVCTPDNSLQ